MKKDPRIFLEHILDSIEHIREYMKGASKRDFFAGVQLQDSVMRRLEIIGEAVKKIPAGIRSKHPGGSLAQDCRDAGRADSRILRSRPRTHLENGQERTARPETQYQSDTEIPSVARTAFPTAEIPSCRR